MKTKHTKTIGLFLIASIFCLLASGCGVKITSDSKEVTVDPAAFNKAIRTLSRK